jgi:hypothetical protein
MTDAQSFWPNGARLAVSVSMQFEAGGQPISGAVPSPRRSCPASPTSAKTASTNTAHAKASRESWTYWIGTASK